jgi:hypothetical protein
MRITQLLIPRDTQTRIDKLPTLFLYRFYSYKSTPPNTISIAEFCATIRVALVYTHLRKHSDSIHHTTKAQHGDVTRGSNSECD